MAPVTKVLHAQFDLEPQVRRGDEATALTWRLPRGSEASKKGYVVPTIFRGLRPEAGNAGSRGDLSHILSFVAHTCARLSPLQKLDMLKKRKRERERDVCIYIYII